jgi:hypothetical protein
MSCRNDAVIRPPGGYMSANIKCDNCVARRLIYALPEFICINHENWIGASL